MKCFTTIAVIALAALVHGEPPVPQNQYLPPLAPQAPSNNYLPPSNNYLPPHAQSRNDYGQQPGGQHGGQQGGSGGFQPSGLGGGNSYGGYGGGGDDQQQNYGPAKYDFQYDVQDYESHNDFGHMESRDGDRTVGRYYVLLPDGRKQVVNYEADQNGYRPVITYEDTGNAYGSGNDGGQNGNGQQNGYNSAYENGNGNKFGGYQ